MKTFNTLAILGLTMAASVPALAAPRQAPVSMAAGSPVEHARATRYCIVEKITGSYIPRRTCNTRADWLNQGFDPLEAK